MTEFTPYTNAHHKARMGWGLGEDVDGLVAAVAAQRARCARGDHQVAEVPANRVVHTRGGAGRVAQRRVTGERYCRRCDVTLARPVRVRCPRCTTVTAGVITLAGHAGLITCAGCAATLSVRLRVRMP